MSSVGPVGIDLGTTNSAVAVFEGGRVRVLENRIGDPLTPSVVAIEEDGSLLVGRPAKELLALRPDRAASAFKRGVGTDQTYTIAEQEFGAVDLSACILRALREDAEAALGGAVTQCVVTVPAYFNEEQRYATMKAAEMAGLEVLRILNEPTAAAIACGIHRSDDDASFLVFDLGGGTFDVCVMERFEGVLQVKSTAGESYLGGEDFTRRLVGVALEQAGLQYERVEMKDLPALGLLLKRCELAKRRLATHDEADVVVPKVEGLLDRAVPLVLTRKDAEKAWQPLFRQLLPPCRAALRGARLSPGDLDEIVLVGGATRMHGIRRFVLDLFEREPATGVDADLAVVHGAAIQAALCIEDEAVEEIVVTDVLSHSLGVEVVRTIGDRHVDGYFAPMIHRNTTIPTSRTDSFFTIYAGQRRLDLSVYEGESRRVNENRLIGNLKVTGIPKGPAGQRIDVTFTYDTNAILEVQARVSATGKVFHAIFTRDSRVLTPAELERAAARLAKLKQDPAQKPRYRDLLLRAELLWRDLPPEARDHLTESLDAFESALATRNPAEISDAYHALKAACDHYDGGERW